MRFNLPGMLLLFFCIISINVFSSTVESDNSQNMTVSFFHGGQWILIGEIEFNKDFSLKVIDFPDNVTGKVKIHISHQGTNAAHIDAVALDGYVARDIKGVDQDATRLLKKLSSSDYDVVNITGKTIEMEFEHPGKARKLFVRGRIEPSKITKQPFQFPSGNMYKDKSKFQNFYNYKLNSNKGTLNIDGDLSNEKLNTPFFTEFCKTGTGHPSEYSRGWVRNDDENLYIAIDFAADNTMDGDLDYSKVLVNTAHGIKEYKISVPEQMWGKAGFEFTPFADYEHKVYEFKIPLTEIDTVPTVQLAFSAYGTAGPPPNNIIDNFSAYDAGSFAAPSSGGAVTAISGFYQERDYTYNVVGTSGYLYLGFNEDASGEFYFNTDDGDALATLTLVYDGPDGDYNNRGSHSYCYSCTHSYLRLVNVQNSGPSSVDIDLTFYGYNPATYYATASTLTIPSGYGPQSIDVPFSSFTKYGGFSFDYVSSFDMKIDNTGYSSPGPGLTIDAVILSDSPLPVELSNFSADIIQEGIKIDWRTITEHDNLGFYLYRIDETTNTEADYQKISELIEGQGTSSAVTDYSYVDENVTEGHVYRYKIVSINAINGSQGNEKEIIVLYDTSLLESNIPYNYVLKNNYPNPFNAGTNIQFSLLHDGSTKLTIFDMNGKLVKTLVNKTMSAGQHALHWDGTDDSGNMVSSGAYLYKLESADFQDTKVMMMVK